MGLIDQAIQDIKDITSNLNDFGVAMTFTAPAPGNQTISITGLHSKHHLGVDGDGNRVNSKNAHVSFSESLMINYPVRNGNGEVSMRNHKVTVKDSTGIDKNYKVQEAFPDETVGLIVCILADLA